MGAMTPDQRALYEEANRIGNWDKIQIRRFACDCGGTIKCEAGLVGDPDHMAECDTCYMFTWADKLEPRGT